MTEIEITALAREYAEEIYRGGTEFIEEVEQVICWLSTRYALVEKEAVRKQFEDAKRLLETCNYNKKCIGVGSRGVLERLFPEIAKEVEG